MSDEELRELAAKAAELDLWTDEHDNLYLPDPMRRWDQLTRSGDAFDLAVELRIKSVYNEDLGRGCAWTGGANDVMAHANMEDCNRSERAAVRRAIVMVAAEIGKAKP